MAQPAPRSARAQGAGYAWLIAGFRGRRRLAVAVAINRDPGLSRSWARPSRTSGKTPSSDGLKRRTKSLRKKSGKKAGGQLRHRGETQTAGRAGVDERSASLSRLDLKRYRSKGDETWRRIGFEGRKNQIVTGMKKAREQLTMRSARCAFFRLPLLEDYEGYIRFANGARISGNDDWYVRIWASYDLPMWGEAHAFFSDDILEAMPIADDGGDECMVFDLRHEIESRHYAICEIPFRAISWDYAR